jgi:tetratricopeptide (TPR) repeat protein
LVERVITFQDAFSILESRFLQGFGLGNWQEQQFMYQSAPYSVRFIHNYYIQLLLDGGVAVIILFLAVVIQALFRGWKRKSIHFFVLHGILLQAVLDFDMAFGAIVLICMFSVSQMQGEKIYEIDFGRFKYVLCIPIIMFASIWGSEWLYQRSNALLLEEKFELSMKACELSLRLNPLNNKAYFNMAFSTRDVDLTEYFLEKALAENEFDSNSMETLIKVQMYNRQYHEAIELAEELLLKWRFNRYYQTLYRNVVLQSATNGAISSEEADERMDFLAYLTSSVNPLYERYIRP